MKQNVKNLVDAVNALKGSANTEKIWELKTLASAINLEELEDSEEEEDQA